jgi:hypothetical protein
MAQNKLNKELKNLRTDPMPQVVFCTCTSRVWGSWVLQSILS